ncbi:MAG: hypothetical protein MUE85_13305 [Microscillaceae bacterium]|jgi:DNA adenine methylase|nr:hypothetical protein [Microscillaceae bacterium]
MKNCNHKWLITYDNSHYIKDMFSFANIMEWNLMYGMRNQTENSDQLGKEIFITNFELDKKKIVKQKQVPPNIVFEESRLKC